MRKLSGVLLSMMFGACGSALASAPAESPTKHIPSVSTMHEVEGAYALSDGRVARLLVLDDRLYIDMNGRDRLELFEVADNSFATRNSEITVEFKPDSEAITVRHETSSKAATPHVIAAKDKQVL